MVISYSIDNDCLRWYIVIKMGAPPLWRSALTLIWDFPFNGQMLGGIKLAKVTLSQATFENLVKHLVEVEE